MSVDRPHQTRRSAIWSAYGDALGFITELADVERVFHRAGSRAVEETVPWRRKVGGRIGVFVDLPAGAYSDDTQLRLATSRAIRADGSFDVAAFAKVELPAWANYALGAGVGSKEAATNLARTSATWYSNFFDNKRASYFRGGGNGAAMRIQPHVWAAEDLSNIPGILRDVIRNSVCTHGHARGIVGACFHAAALAWSMKNRAVPSLRDCRGIIDSLAIIPEVVTEDGDLRLFWLGPWEERVRQRFAQAVQEVMDEMFSDLSLLCGVQEANLAHAYADAVNRLDGKNPTLRGSATKTALLANFLACHSVTGGLPLAMSIAANCLGSDTDSIATIAGAMLGACSNEECEAAIQDRPYIETEALRLADVASKRPSSSFRYPDLRSWKPVRASIDAVTVNDGALSLAGIGRMQPIGADVPQRIGNETLQWFQLPFGQSILARVREVPITSESKSIGSPSPDQTLTSKPTSTGIASRLPDLFAEKSGRSTRNVAVRDDLNAGTLNDALKRVIASNFDPELIGKLLLAYGLSGRADFVEQGIALTATILTAFEARSRKRR